jgi:hypothetical protein
MRVTDVPAGDEVMGRIPTQHTTHALPKTVSANTFTWSREAANASENVAKANYPRPALVEQISADSVNTVVSG